MTTDTLTVEEPSPSNDGGRVVCSSVLRGRASKAGVTTVLTRGDVRSCALGGDPSARSASLCRFDARLPGLRLPVSRTPSAAPSAGTATWASAWRPMATRSPTSPCASGSRGERGEVPGVRVVSAGPRMALYTPRRAPAGAAAARLRRRRALAPAPPRRPLRRGPHRVVSVLLAARGGGRAPAPALPAGGRLARGVERASTGGSTSADVGGMASVGRCRPSACACPSAPSASRGCTQRRLREAARERRADRARGRVRGAQRCRASRRPRSGWWSSPGRHIPEKRVPALVPALAHRPRARTGAAGARSSGDGPEREEVLRLRSQHGLDEALDVPGFVSAERRRERTSRERSAWCCPSRREGYGMVVIEAAALGTPSVVVADPTTPAADLVVDGENGFVAPSAAPEDLAAAIERVHAEGQALRQRTAAWFAAQCGTAVPGHVAPNGARELRGRIERAAVGLRRFPPPPPPS